MDDFEERIINGFKNNDIRAFNLLFNKYYSDLCLYAFDIIGKSEMAKEIVHDVFIKIWNSRETINIETTFKGYLFRAVHNQSLNYIRYLKNLNNPDLISTDDTKNKVQSMNFEVPPEIIEKLFSDQFEKEFEKAMKTLPQQCRKIFYLSRFEELSYSEIAVKLNLAVSTVKTQMLRAILKLKNELKDLI